MAAEFDELVARAKGKPRETTLNSEEREAARGATDAVKAYFDALREAGVIQGEAQIQETDIGIRIAWWLTDELQLVVIGAGPVVLLPGGYHARVSAGIATKDGLFIGMPCCGHYMAPDRRADSLGTHDVILKCIADLVAQYRSRSTS